MGAHDVTLQRLDVFHTNNGVSTYYSPEHFKNVESWTNIPVVMPLKAFPGLTIKHPKHELVKSGLSNSEEYKRVGYVKSASLANSGEPTLRGSIVLEDPQADALAREGKLSLSTGFNANLVPLDSERQAISSAVEPNHVLVFPRNYCRNCTPNDKGAVFENIEGDQMTEDNKAEGMLSKILARFDQIDNAKTTVGNVSTTETDALKAEIAALKASQEAQKAQIGNLEAAAEQARKDTQWATMCNVLPAGWLGDKEPDTRKDFETDPAAFVLKLTAHNTEHPPVTKQAQGKTSVGNVEDEAAFNKQVEDFTSKTGMSFAGE